ncbi:MAG TPA: DNA polymerase domain-containing protein [Polyangiaceae bacterium]|nr:DNA polymerase domain-containing protein [Polyangiaceae bacterium]
MAEDSDFETLKIGSHEVRITHPSKRYFDGPVVLTKLDLARYYLAVAEGALCGVRDRPLVLKRFVNGAMAPPFYQKRAPEHRPDWLQTVTLSFPSGRTAEELVISDAASLLWVVNLGCIELHPHAVRAQDLDHPDELRVDLDPGPGVNFEDVRRVALEVRAVLEENGLKGYPKTSGSRGIHINVRIEPRWSFTEVRRAALALSREVERRIPNLATSKWWKEERHGVFLDYNQNAKDRTTCSAYSVRPLPDARVSTPLTWEEVPSCDPAEFTVLSVPRRVAERGDPHADIDREFGSLHGLLELADRDEAAGLGDAPWPPHFAKGEKEGTRVAPSRARGARARSAAHAKTDATPNGTAQSETQAESSARPASETETVAVGHSRKRQKMPLIVVANSPDRDAALAGLERWKVAHPEAAQHLAIDDILIDSMRGRSTTWTRIRLNLRHVPETLRPEPEKPDPDDDPTREYRRATRERNSETAPRVTKAKKKTAQ